MLFQIYGENAGYQPLGCLLVFTCLVLANEIARRTKIGGICCFLVLPAVLTVYFIAIYVGAARGTEWALTKQTYDSPMVTFCSAKQVKVITETPIPWSLDGEKEEGLSEITMHNLHHAIRLVK